MARTKKHGTANIRYRVVRNISLFEGVDFLKGSVVTDADVFGKAEVLLDMGLVEKMIDPAGDVGTKTLIEETE